MDKALEKMRNNIAIAFSGAEDVALINYAKLTDRPFRVFSLDTGWLNPETYRFFDAVEKHYGIRIEYMFPDAVEVQALVLHGHLDFKYDPWPSISESAKGFGKENAHSRPQAPLSCAYSSVQNFEEAKTTMVAIRPKMLVTDERCYHWHSAMPSHAIPSLRCHVSIAGEVYCI